MLDAALPLLFLAALALAHFLYFRLASATPVQQSVRVADFPSSGPAPALVRSPLPAARPSRYRRALVLGNAFYDQPLICGCSLTINGVALFKGAVKVSGDLLIVGRAEFTRPVVANGKVVVLGQAIFRQGLLAKSALVVRGQAAIGSAAQGAWLVARTASVDGDLWLNGEFETFAPLAQRRA
jgi:hypothetical protein